MFPKDWSRFTKIEITLGFIILYSFLWASSALLVSKPNDLDVFFLPATVNFLKNPSVVYSIRFEKSNQVHTFANGPLSLLPLSAITFVEQKMDILDNFYLRRMLILAVFSLFSLLMANEAIKAIENLKNHKLADVKKLLFISLFLFSPPLWVGVLSYGHIELPILLWLILLGIRKLNEKKSILAGILFGLALLDKSTAILSLVPIFFYVAFTNGFKNVVKLILAAFAIFFIGLAPFLLANFNNVWFSLAKYRSLLPINESSIWNQSSFLKHFSLIWKFDVESSIVIAVLLSFFLFRKRVGFKKNQIVLFAGLTISALSFPLILKTPIWPYYFLNAYVFSVIWSLGKKISPAKVCVPFAVLVCFLIILYSISQKHSLGFYFWESIIVEVLITGTIAYMEIYSLRRREDSNL